MGPIFLSRIAVWSFIYSDFLALYVHPLYERRDVPFNPLDIQWVRGTYDSLRFILAMLRHGSRHSSITGYLGGFVAS